MFFKRAWESCLSVSTRLPAYLATAGGRVLEMDKHAAVAGVRVQIQAVALDRGKVGF